MREIKFRQWQGKYRPWHYFEFTDGMCSGVSNATLSKFPIMQYTGLKDKNGKEIYEDDIVSVNFSGNLRTRKIKFHNGAYRFVKGNCQKNSPSKLLNPSMVYKRQIEVIGNIHENPELL